MSGGGKNNRVPLLTGVHHVTVPTSDPLAASDWYVRVFDFAALLMEERENEVVAVLLQHPVRCRTQCGARGASGWAVTLTGPDLVRIQLQTAQGPSGEDE
jgi:catechol 2,3-dioxygenase-like lactoylglutathione lyase family enzyme